MTDYNATALRLPTSSTATSGPKRDPILNGLADGDMRFLFDLDFSWCYPGGPVSTRPAQGAPTTNDQTLYDISERADANIIAVVNRTPAYSNGGFDFSAIVNQPYGIKAPSDIWETIHAGDQNFLWCSYQTLPSEADWKPSEGNLTMFEGHASSLSGTYVSNATALTVYQITPSATGNPSLYCRRQIQTGNAASNARVLFVEPTASHFGQMCQIAYWRTDEEEVLQLRSASETISKTLSRGANSTEDFSASGATWGVPSAFSQAMSSEDANGSNYRLFRGFVEDLGRSGRNPSTVLSDDWDRVQARIGASGGTIFI